VGSDANWKRRTSVIVFADEVAVILVAEFIVSAEPDAGEKVTFDAGTWV